MKLYIIANGYIGNDYVHCLVVANSEEEAKDLAAIEFKKETKEVGYPEGYYTNLKVEYTMDASKPGASVPMGG